MTAILKKRGYPVQHERIIEEVMRRFDLLYDSNEHGPEQRMLIPLMLPELEPKISWPTDGTLEFVYQYEVMPAGMVPAFMARQHKYISKAVASWRHGCVLEIKGCQVRAIGDVEQKRVLLSVAGAEAQRRDALDQIRATFESLHGAVKNLPVLELIPVPGHPQAPMLDYQFVRSLEWQGKSSFETKGTDFGQIITVNVGEALDGIRGAARKQRDEEQRQAAEETSFTTINVHSGANLTLNKEIDMSENYTNTGVNQGNLGKGNQQTNTNSFNTGVHGAELAKLLEALRTAFHAEKQYLSPDEVKTVDRCLTQIEAKAKEKEPDGSVIKSMGGKLVKAIETSTKAVGLVEAATKLWGFCQQWV